MQLITKTYLSKEREHLLTVAQGDQFVCVNGLEKYFPKLPLVYNGKYTVTISESSIKGSRRIEFCRIYMVCHLGKGYAINGLDSLNHAFNVALYRFLKQESKRFLYVKIGLDTTE